MDGGCAMPKRSIAEIDSSAIGEPDQFQRDVVAHCGPLVIRNLVRQWPVTQAALKSTDALRAYFDRFVTSGEVELFVGAPDIGGKYYYTNDLSTFNFERRTMGFGDAVAAILTPNIDDTTLYMGSVPTDVCIDGFSAANPMPLLAPGIAPRLWLGHASDVSAHYDTLDNLACVIAGSRRFTLFPPGEVGNLYVGPIDHTMAGQPVSLAASSPRDTHRYPRFEAARETMMVADLHAGDALYLPKLWWHKVEATAPVNGLVNYWWDAFAAGPDSPYTALLLSMITLSERPPVEREAWRAFFEHYVFRRDGHPLAHLPVDRHGLLGPLRQNYGAIRARVMHMLRNFH